MVVQKANQGVNGVLVQLVLRVSSAHRVGLEVDNLFQNLASWLDSVTRKAYDVFLQGIGHNLELLNLVAAFSPIGKSLTIELITRNTGDKAFSITQALHTYFKVGDINKVQVLGLAGNSYIDKVDGGKEKTQSGEIAFTEECDRIYLDVQPELTIDDAALNRKIKVSTTNSKTAIVWNPWATISANMSDLDDNDYLNFVCVETANAANEVIKVAAGNEYKLSANYAIAN